MTETISSFVFSLIPFFIATILHEISHAVTAYLLGDDTAKRSGRFNLHTHFDLLGSFILPFSLYSCGLPMLGYAVPVPVNPHRFKDPKADMAVVAAAGPLCNAVLALISINANNGLINGIKF